MKATTRLFLAVLFLSSSAFAADVCKVNVATCGPVQCAFLPGVGMKTAGLISAAHPKNAAELDAVKGLGEKKLAGMAPYVTYQGETTCAAKQPKVPTVADPKL